MASVAGLDFISDREFPAASAVSWGGAASGAHHRPPDDGVSARRMRMCSEILGIIIFITIITLIKQAWVTWLFGIWPWKKRK